VKIQFLSFPGCPHARPSLERLRAVMRELELSYPIEEVEITASQVQAELRGWGSPTVLVDGRDVAGVAEPTGEATCRLYPTGDGLTRS